MIGQISLAAIFLLILMTLKVPAPREVARTFAPLIPNQREDRKIVLNNIEAKSVFIFDISQNKMLYEKNSSDPLPLASLTKLMTILLLEEKSRDGVFIPISKDAVLQPHSEGMEPGDRFEKEDLEEFTLASSSNDGAWAAAEYLSGGDIENFALLMNERARELGLSSLNFSNPTGLDITIPSSRLSGAFGNAKDISLLLKYIYENYPNILAKTRKWEISITSLAGRTINATNTNEALGDIPQIIAGKTGYTMVAGGNLAFILSL
ncbi:MAG: Serine-type D-Ala-D-Ala carboxypeptidase [Candidatus Giovannonibacteria bacterium GW2011_GWA2_45_21]|uniref:Serine-type D-Ala-D-Ala carboxypeptidase n=1 Tax=Candidatus Giovannonibacteria bacterium GW2011_GWA2_45_21 TaxID=1618649 RepID=A0A0G1M6I6_9BACT|nr:MAG: Serine-type D-Ala-D-Ala carboxypeptidase [Candidatus Giovannonibacteria bacterium GW2011_GWA2_45_21]